MVPEPALNQPLNPQQNSSVSSNSQETRENRIRKGTFLTTDTILLDRAKKRIVSSSEELELFKLETDSFYELFTLQDRVIDTLEGRPWLRRSSPEELMEHIERQDVLGVNIDEDLVAVAILYDGKTTNESIRGLTTSDEAQMRSSINLKAIFTSPDHRQFGLGRRIVTSLNSYVPQLGKTEIACTIHKDNQPSKRMFTRLGYEYQGEALTSYGHREIYSLQLSP